MVVLLALQMVGRLINLLNALYIEVVHILILFEDKGTHLSRLTSDVTGLAEDSITL